MLLWANIILLSHVYFHQLLHEDSLLQWSHEVYRHINYLAIYRHALKDNGITVDIHVVISGLANTYTDYITTPEEYSVQRYEGASIT